MNQRMRAESSTPAMPKTRSRGSFETRRATSHIASSGLETTMRIAFGRARKHLAHDVRDDALVGRDEVVAAHAGLARQAGGDHDDVGVRGRVVGVGAGHAGVELLDRGRLHDVERLALRDALDDVDEGDVGRAPSRRSAGRPWPRRFRRRRRSLCVSCGSGFYRTRATLPYHHHAHDRIPPTARRARRGRLRSPARRGRAVASPVVGKPRVPASRSDRRRRRADRPGNARRSPAQKVDPGVSAAALVERIGKPSISGRDRGQGLAPRDLDLLLLGRHADRQPHRRPRPARLGRRSRRRRSRRSARPE